MAGESVTRQGGVPAGATGSRYRPRSSLVCPFLSTGSRHVLQAVSGLVWSQLPQTPTNVQQL